MSRCFVSESVVLVFFSVVIASCFWRIVVSVQVGRRGGKLTSSYIDPVVTFILVRI